MQFEKAEVYSMNKTSQIISIAREFKDNMRSSSSTTVTILPS